MDMSFLSAKYASPLKKAAAFETRLLSLEWLNLRFARNHVDYFSVMFAGAGNAERSHLATGARERAYLYKGLKHFRFFDRL